MSLSNKKKPGINHKKINAHHHRHTKNYLKTYWPYIPILLIVGIGLIINMLWKESPSPYTNVRLANFTYYDILESSIGIIALTIFLLRHAFAWHKVLIRGEDFVAKHPLLDISLVLIATIGILLSRHGIKVV